MSEPRRRTLRKRNIALIILGIFLALIAWAGYWINWAYTVEPSPSVDYAAQMEQLSREAQPRGENGWPDLLRAVAIYERLDSAFPPAERVPHHMDGFAFEAIYDASYEPRQFGPYDIGDITAEDVHAEKLRALAWLESSGAWEAIAAAGAKPNMVRPMDAEGEMLLDLRLPEVGALRNLAQARLATLHLALESGDESGAEQAVQDLLTLGRASSNQPFIIYGLVGDAFRTMLYEYVQQEIVLGRLAPSFAAHLLALLNANPPPLDMVIQFEGERRWLLDLIQWFHSDDGDGDGILLYARVGPILASTSTHGGFTAMSWDQPDWHPITNLAGLAYASRAETTAKANVHYDRMVHAVRSTQPGHGSEVNMIANEVRSLGDRFALLQLFLPALGKAITKHDALRMRHDGTRILLAIELYRAEHGDPPESLADVVPEFMSEFPTDALTGEPFGYRLLDSDPQGREYLLYSIGLDGEDNGGAFDDIWADRALTTPETGVDYVINQGRAEE